MIDQNKRAKMTKRTVIRITSGVVVAALVIVLARPFLRRSSFPSDLTSTLTQSSDPDGFDLTIENVTKKPLGICVYPWNYMIVVRDDHDNILSDENAYLELINVPKMMDSDFVVLQSGSKYVLKLGAHNGRGGLHIGPEAHRAWCASIVSPVVLPESFLRKNVRLVQVPNSDPIQIRHDKEN